MSSKKSRMRLRRRQPIRFANKCRFKHIMADTQNIDIDYVADLARIALTDDEKDLFSKQLGDILGYIEKLKSADVSTVEPMAHAFPVCNVWDEDEPVEGLSVDEALMNAPVMRDNMFVVPKVVE